MVTAIDPRIMAPQPSGGIYDPSVADADKLLLWLRGDWHPDFPTHGIYTNDPAPSAPGPGAASGSLSGDNRIAHYITDHATGFSSYKGPFAYCNASAGTQNWHGVRQSAGGKTSICQRPDMTTPPDGNSSQCYNHNGDNPPLPSRSNIPFTTDEDEVFGFVGVLTSSFASFNRFALSFGNYNSATDYNFLGVIVLSSVVYPTYMVSDRLTGDVLQHRTATGWTYSGTGIFGMIIHRDVSESKVFAYHKQKGGSWSSALEMSTQVTKSGTGLNYPDFFGDSTDVVSEIGVFGRYEQSSGGNWRGFGANFQYFLGLPSVGIEGYQAHLDGYIDNGEI